ncbi:MAG: hypothetical protein CTY35_02045 [Methylotenera sp.]|uniref:hypothetical protein n=1 Tax=Methylotenera sp. TaxID=2051956 RepID=UPI000D44E250|nr:hypothetical protein [Methylotenera sp.]PPC84406.1 MAG: hypothetical protein CTY38_02265 [Methylotenera sp.]PPD01048.1 MAG: hypothetical protein CTY35_02045 [Methylotenera sp.]
MVTVYLNSQLEEAVKNVATLRKMHLSKVIHFANKNKINDTDIRMHSPFSYSAAMQTEKLIEVLDAVKENPSNFKELEHLLTNGEIGSKGRKYAFHPDMLKASRESIANIVEIAKGVCESAYDHPINQKSLTRKIGSLYV